MSRLDHAALKTALSEAAREGWAAFEREHPDDEVYGVGLYTSSLATYIAMTVFSEAGLEEVAQEYADRAGKDLEAEKVSLRWSPCDSPHHLWREDLFADSQRILDAAPDPYEADHADRVDGAFEVFVGVLRALDAEGLFGPDRDRIVSCIWLGDQSNEDRVDYARRLNPREVAERFEDELEEGVEAFFADD